MALPKRPGNPFRHVKAAYRSGLEVVISGAIAAAGVTALYEQVRIPFTQPAKSRTYTPDFALPNGIIVETKGVWDADDRAKHKLVKEQHPDLDIRIVFSNARAKLSKGSSTTYADVATKLGIPFSHKVLPPEWLREPVEEARLAAMSKLIKR